MPIGGIILCSCRHARVFVLQLTIRRPLSRVAFFMP
jgi:hypothetical protein